MAEILDDACISCFTGFMKPDRTAYEGALERIDSIACRSLYVGDGGSDELIGARDAGFALVIAVTGPVRRGGWRSSSEQQRIELGADLLVEDVADLATFVEI